MNRNVRRFAATLSLTVILAGAPAAIAAPRDGRDRDLTPIVKIVRSLLRFIGVTITAEPSGPPPAPAGDKV